MSQATLTYQAPNTLQLSGELNFSSAMQLYRQGIGCLDDQPINTIDLAGVTSSNSAGLALLLEWKHKNQLLKFINMPMNMIAAAEVYGIMSLFH